jgi:uncharacterized Rmd1/YagE family protein
MTITESLRKMKSDILTWWVILNILEIIIVVGLLKIFLKQ